MDKVDDLSLMMKFDFNQPTDKTIIFDDSNDATSSKNTLLKKRLQDKQNENNSDQKGGTKNLENNKTSEILKNNEDLKGGANYEYDPKNLITLLQEMLKNIFYHNGQNKETDKNTKDAENPKNIDNQRNQNKTVPYQYLDINDVRNNKEINAGNVAVINNETNNKDPVITCIDDSLNTLSEHLIIVMLSYYRYHVLGMTKDYHIVDPEGFLKRNKEFTTIKAYFFELSYTTMVSIILPQVQNKNFINIFLDNTIAKANTKLIPLKLRCLRCHLDKFFYELIEWSSQKKERLKSFNLNSLSKNNKIIMEHLNRPIRMPNSTRESLSDPKPQTNICIFSAGSPENEISINVNSDLLINSTQSQCNNSVEITGNQNNYTHSQTALIYPPVAIQTHKSKQQGIQKKKKQNSRHNPPSYNEALQRNMPANIPVQYKQNVIHSVKNYYQNFEPQHQNHVNARLISNRPNVPCHLNDLIRQVDNYPYVIHSAQNQASIRYQNHFNERQNLNNNSNERQWLQNHPSLRLQPLGNHPSVIQSLQNDQNVDRSIQQYQTEPIQNLNSTRWSPDSGYSEYLHDNSSTNQQHEPFYNQNQMASGPLITNVTSLLPNERTSNGRCCMCGKTTVVTCTKCNKPSYCSLLCKELDSQFKKKKEVCCKT